MKEDICPAPRLDLGDAGHLAQLVLIRRRVDGLCKLASGLDEVLGRAVLEQLARAEDDNLVIVDDRAESVRWREMQ